MLALPLFHVHGLGLGLRGTLTAGASAVLRPRFDAGDLLDSVRDHEASLWFGVPSMYARVADSPRLGELARLRLCVSGSAPLHSDRVLAPTDLRAVGTWHEGFDQTGDAEVLELLSAAVRWLPGRVARDLLRQPLRVCPARLPDPATRRPGRPRAPRAVSRGGRSR